LLKYSAKDSLDDASLERIDRIQSASENLEKQIDEKNDKIPRRD